MSNPVEVIKSAVETLPFPRAFHVRGPTSSDHVARRKVSSSEGDCRVLYGVCVEVPQRHLFVWEMLSLYR